jgi:hypothetical protein
MTVGITVLTSSFPEQVCKTYALEDGALKMRAVANVIRAKAKMVPVETAADLVAVLHKVTEIHNQVIVPGRWIDGEAPFEVITESELVKLVGVKGQQIEGGVHNVSGRRVAARLKRSIINSAWTLFDADDPEGMPPEWRGMPVAGRLAAMPSIRAAFKHWALEEAKFPHELVHQPTPVERAYLRSSDLQCRRHMMEAWAAYLMGGSK